MNSNTQIFLEKNQSPTLNKPFSLGLFNSLNPLISAALPLLLLIIKFKQPQVQPRNIGELRRQIIAEINNFVERAKNFQCTSRHILAARYCLCTALDETILATTWATQGDWAQQTLLSIVQKETWGGERFFIILEEMAKSSQENLLLLELIYIILSLGFEGKYYSHEQSIRDEIRHRLFYLIAVHREEPQQQLSAGVKTSQIKNKAVQRYPSHWKIAGFTLLLVLGIGTIFNAATYLTGRKVLQEIAHINQALTTPAVTDTPLPNNFSEKNNVVVTPKAAYKKHRHHRTSHERLS